MTDFLLDSLKNEKRHEIVTEALYNGIFFKRKEKNVLVRPTINLYLNSSKEILELIATQIWRRKP